MNLVVVIRKDYKEYIIEKKQYYTKEDAQKSI